MSFLGPENLSIVQGDLLDCKEQFLVHQCNCVTVKGAHLSGDVFARFPQANIYIERLKTNRKDMPGQIIVRGKVINMLAQYYPGKSRFANDTGSLRREWFQSCLNEIAKLPDVVSLAFPYNIGCGAAGGNWPQYLEMITNFAKKSPNIKITLYQLPQQTTSP